MKTRTPPASMFQIWEARDFTDSIIDGYLITNVGNLNAPLAFTYPGLANGRDGYRLARSIVFAWDNGRSATYGRWRDLRIFGRPDSEEAMPGFLYGLQCRPVDDLADWIEGAEPVEPAPLCYVRLKRFTGQRQAQRAPKGGTRHRP